MRDEMRRRSMGLLATRLALLAGAVATAGYETAAEQLIASAIPDRPRQISVDRALTDTRPLRVTVTRDWKKVHLQSSVDAVTADPAIWMEMHLGDWDRLPADVRGRGLRRLLHRFEGAVAGPAVWSGMTPSDWDRVPQPIRMVAFPLMIEYWVEAYQLGHAHALPPGLLTNTVSAIVMAESWFQHRADVVNEWGNRDVGLGQCSDRCRRDLSRMAKAGLLDFSLADDDYLNPWHATRAAVVWFGLELARAGGDVDLAIRAYHRGARAAMDAKGDAYLANVERLRRLYFGAESKLPHTWERLSAWGRSRVVAQRERPVLQAVNAGPDPQLSADSEDSHPPAAESAELANPPEQSAPELRYP